MCSCGKFVKLVSISIECRSISAAMGHWHSVPRGCGISPLDMHSGALAGAGLGQRELEVPSNLSRALKKDGFISPADNCSAPQCITLGSPLPRPSGRQDGDRDDFEHSIGLSSP